MNNELFSCEHLKLTRKNMDDVDNFMITVPEGKGLMDFLQQDAFHNETVGLCRTYLVRDIDSEELAGYFSLRAGLISSNEKIMDDGDEQVSEFDVIPGIELSALAINERYIEAHPRRKGCGLIIFNDFVLPLVNEAAKIIGVQVLYGFSVDEKGKLMKKYIQEYGFERLDSKSEKMLHERLRPRNENDCVFIFKRL